MQREFKSSHYELRPKYYLNSLVIKKRPRNGIWLNLLKSDSEISKLSEFTYEKLFFFLNNFFDYIYWPELSDEPQSGTKINFNPMIREFINQEKEFTSSFSFKNVASPSNFKTKTNYLVNDVQNLNTEDLEKLLEKGFETLKIKISKTFEDDIRRLIKLDLKNFEVRLDFNSALEKKNIIDASPYLKKIKNIEYLEDPTVYSENDWKILSKLFPLALDQRASLSRLPTEVSVFVLKPVRTISRDLILNITASKKKITISNMMDSPLGTWKSFLYYMLLKMEYPSIMTTPGLYTFHLFEEMLFNTILPLNGSEFIFNSITFGKLLNYLSETKWESLSEN